MSIVTSGTVNFSDLRLVFKGVTAGSISMSELYSNGVNASGISGIPASGNVINVSYGGADGGTQSAGGSYNGGYGTGGENATNTGWNGGGGGGYYGGGACKGQHGAGAGGSGYYNSNYVSSFNYNSSGGGSAA